MTRFVGTPTKAKKGVPKVVYSNPYYQVQSIEVDYGEFKKEYFVTHFGRRVGVLLVKEDCILLTRQYRFLPEQRSWEIPGGKVDEGETLQEAAIRECQEETGFTPKSLKHLIFYEQSLEVIQTPTTIFFTENFVEMDNFNPLKTEVESKEWVCLSKCMEMITAGELVDSFSVIALLSYWKLKNSPSIC